MEARITVAGTAPLLMHNGRLSDPLDPATKAKAPIAGKRQKTDDDHRLLADIEWTGGLYWDDEVGPYIPGENLWRSLYDAAGQDKMRPRVKVGLRVLDFVNPLVYDGPRDQAKLRDDANFRFRKSVKTQMVRTIRTRPMFKQWGCSFRLSVDESKLNLSDVKRIADNAGSSSGLGDWRPMFGTFRAEVEAVR